MIAGSNRVLEEEVYAHRFRSDLYHRLNVIGFHLPPLREPREEITALVSKFIREFSTRNEGRVAAITSDALQVLERYDWPGNVRELRNLIEHSVTLCPGAEIRIEDLPDSVRKSRPFLNGNHLAHPSLHANPSLGRSTLAQIKREAELARITEALEKHSNNRLRAASELGISRMTLYKKLYKYGLMQQSSASQSWLRRRDSSPVNLLLAISSASGLLVKASASLDHWLLQTEREPGGTSMLTSSRNTSKAKEENLDPISGEPGAHPIGTGLGAAAAGAATGMAGGAVAGPAGAAIGAVIGAVAGGLGGKAIAESIDPTVEDAYCAKTITLDPTPTDR